MANEDARHSDVIDPLAAYSGISLFPRAFGILPDQSQPRDPGTDLDDIHKHLKSMVIRSPSKLVEQAKTILDGNVNFMHSEIATSFVMNEKKEETTTKMEENPQERRPALNRKRARFSLKPDVGPLAMNLEPTLDIKQLKDPEEFFLAYEKLENAKREIQKQMGGIMKDLNQQNLSMNTRQRRPGILGRSVRYKYQYSSITSENDENALPSQVTFESANINPLTMGSEQDRSPSVVRSEKENDEDFLIEEELVTSITKAENKVNKILDELLSVNCEDLEGDRAINILQECLQIKPIHLEKLCLPDLQGIQSINLKPSRENLPKHRLMGADNLLQRIENVKFKQDAESPVNPLTSSTPLKSPLASLSSLKRRILLSNSSSDPFSTHDIDQSPTGNPYRFEHNTDLSDMVDITKQSSDSKLKSLLTVDGGIITNRISSPKVPIGDVDPISEISSSNVLNETQAGACAASSATRVSLEDNDIAGHSEEVINEKLSCLEAQAEDLANASNALDDKMEEHEGLEQPDTSMVDAIEEHMIQTPDQSTATSGEKIVDGLSKNGGTNHRDQVKPKSQANRQRKVNKNSRRQSLAAAGTKWECGVRRSTRIKTRPLEYWKGERLLYGRVHESLATVIGMKYVSPAKGNGKPTLKVKSFVSDEYKELVESAALH